MRQLEVPDEPRMKLAQPAHGLTRDLYLGRAAGMQQRVRGGLGRERLRSDQGFQIAFYVVEVDRAARRPPLLRCGSAVGNATDAQWLMCAAVVAQEATAELEHADA